MRIDPHVTAILPCRMICMADAGVYVQGGRQRPTTASSEIGGRLIRGEPRTEASDAHPALPATGLPHSVCTSRPTLRPINSSLTALLSAERSTARSDHGRAGQMLSTAFPDRAATLQFRRSSDDFALGGALTFLTQTR